MFLVGDPNLKLYLPLESWEGGQRNIYVYIVYPIKSDMLIFQPMLAPNRSLPLAPASQGSLP